MQSSTFCALLSGDKHIISILPAPNEALERTAHLAGFFRLLLVPSRVGRAAQRQRYVAKQGKKLRTICEMDFQLAEK